MSTGDKKRLRVMGCRIGAAVFIVHIILSGCFCAAQGGERWVTFYNAGGQKACVFSVELAIAPEEQERGLMFREKLPDNCGMLFLYSDDDIRHFWMKNTFISLDMIFLNAKRKVVGVFHAARPRDPTTISSIYPARYVLEVNAG
ncbi:MAG TPA: DUF192 domain-containing protein, partial [Syntrophorhabdaceae bacterium]|nr:DUF192 domain-containing protein [Syntrophorhabdaceae bacterium]